MELRSAKTISKSLSRPAMKRRKSSMPLPVELVEKILAMIPFPQIFKVRTLSKSWCERFSPISSQDDEEQRLLALSFQRLVCESSDNWKPRIAFLSRDFLIAYNRASQRWRKIPTALPASKVLEVKAWTDPTVLKARSTYRDDRFAPSSVLLGALLFITASLGDVAFIVNIFTWSWKKLPALPARPRMVRQWDGSPKRLVSGGTDMYKVITFYLDAGYTCAWIYDSKLGAWRSKRVEVLDGLEHFELGLKDVYLNGVLYVLVRVRLSVWGFLAFDVKDETFSLLQMPLTDLREWEYDRQELLACNGTVYVVCRTLRHIVILLEADLVSRRWLNAIRGPPAALRCTAIHMEVSSDGDCLFFEATGRGKFTSNRKILAYNVRKNEWSYVAGTSRMIDQSARLSQRFSSDISFQPGMNPFVEV